MNRGQWQGARSLAWCGLLLTALLAGCESAYYRGMEKIGIPKRDILVDRVEGVQAAQRDGQEQFRSALEQFRALVNVDGGKLEKTYDRLDREYQDSVAAAQKIRDRVDSVESVAEALFDEWEDELDAYQSAALRRDSAAKLKQTRTQYTQLMKAMRQAEARLDPVLKPLADQVLYLKHNLNARAIGSLKGELSTLNSDVDRLIQAMEASIAEADRFIAQMNQ
jgi:chromosome segregation ATPase